MRTILAMLVAPLLGACSAWLFLWLINASLMGEYFILAALLVCSLVTFVLGVPALLFYRSLALSSWQAFLAGGVGLSLIPGALLWLFSDSIYLLLAAVLAGSIEALVIWAVAARKSNNSFKPTPLRGAA